MREVGGSNFAEVCGLGEVFVGWRLPSGLHGRDREHDLDGSCLRRAGGGVEAGGDALGGEGEAVRDERLHVDAASLHQLDAEWVLQKQRRGL